MNYFYRAGLLTFLSIFLWTTVFGTSPIVPSRLRLNINRDWKFKLGDYTGAEDPLYADGNWDSVNLPHNFSIPYFRSDRWYAGFGWYRKVLNIPQNWHDKRISIEFEGAFRETQIYVNGHLAGKHNGGYTGFIIDMTPYLHPGKNMLAVRVNNDWKATLAPRNGDHNFTGGIYRDVYLVATNPVHVAWYGTFITTPEVSKNKSTVQVQTEIQNDDDHIHWCRLQTTVIDAQGKKVTEISSALSVANRATAICQQRLPVINNPQLWEPAHPYLYRAISQVLDHGKIIDKFETSFGIRSLRWTADSGMFLNGKHYYFKGADVHQDHAGWASAVTNAAIARDVAMVKECGMDFIRGSHYPHDPAFSDACDRLGVLLWEENDFWGSGGTQKETGNWFDGAGAYPANLSDQAAFEQSVKNDLTEMIRIHRNHPSIIAWSMCNEPFFTDRGTMPKVRAFLADLVQLSHKLDPTRAVGIGGAQRGAIDKIGDVAGYNGDGARLFINPGIPSVVTEYGSTIAVRPGKYIPGWGDLQQEVFPWRSGQALWCAFDYGTRAGEFGKMGMIDYFRLPKNMWYWYRNAYRHIPPPHPPGDEPPASLQLTADKRVIKGTDGTDDILLKVAVLDQQGKPTSRSPDVTLTIVSGPGEFPTGRSITFSNQSDIFIGDGLAAIEFRSYEGGQTVIRASSPGIVDGTIRITTVGLPMFMPGKTPVAAYRPYIRYTGAGVQTNTAQIDVAYQKPTRASSERAGMTANYANDHNPGSMWQATTDKPGEWVQVDLENLYAVSMVKLVFGAGTIAPYHVQITLDGQHWITLEDTAPATDNERTRSIRLMKPVTGRFIRVSFDGGAAPAVAEIEVYGSIEQKK